MTATSPLSPPTTLGVRPTDDAPTPGYESQAPLGRTLTSGSAHAQSALRRMATHETGDYAEGEDRRPEGLDTHDEDQEDNPRDVGRNSENPEGSDEEKNIEGKHSRGKKKEAELQDQTNLLPTKQVILVFCGLTCALFCSLLDQTIVTTALPTLGQVFNRADIAPWVGTAYLLTSTTAQPIYGRISDIFGRKFTLLACLFIFLMGSLACSLAQTMIQLIVFRAIQGLGGGGILTLSMIIISDVVSLKERGKYQGINGVVIALSNSLGPILGGVFTEKVTWRWCFYINLPITSLSIIIIIFLLPLRRVRGSMWGKIKKLDFWGSLLTLAWAVPFLIALSWAGARYSWDSAPVLAPLLIGLALLGVFIFVEAKLISLPLVPMHIFNNRSTAANYFTTFMNGLSFYATLYYLPQYFQVVRGDSAIRSGVLTLPLMLVQTVSSFASGILVSKTGDYWWNLVTGFSIWTVGLGLLSSIGTDTSIAKLCGYQVIVGFGAGQTFQTSLVAIQASVERKDMATATGLRNFLRMLGGTIALAACTSIVNNSVKKNLQGVLGDAQYQIILNDPTQAQSLGLSASQFAAVTAAYAQGIREVFWFCTPCIGICVPVTAFLVKKISLKREDDAVKKAESKAWVESKKAKKKARSNRLGSEDTAVASERETQNKKSSEESHST
ncbi:tetracycline efflux protein [Cryptococcus wingfieldii CBS 7118]|uniref:Tetracycline efflux protein n=1 Tax=Cryptococcus wingfieldii CBS 7118 TaxID=1295528 RepID=A0A1E3K4S0_9TREE|nr:tetracycline efflux protein [Cryptococcus wingfieldii CBS 7118]ODO07242.1 tetracycline efflux protein [Cryptococcus wingfieldii CBS 7118]